MGSNLIFKSGFPESGGENGSRTENARTGNFPLSRQSSIYSLTFDEFQNGLGKDFGSMNMDEFLKNVWFAEEGQGFGTPLDVPQGNSDGLARQFSLQRQGSLTLPRTLSLRTVDEVFRDMLKESVEQSDNISTGPQRQPTLGEMTLEEFLVKAGVVREDTQTANLSNNGVFFGNYGNNTVGNGNLQVRSDISLALGFGQPNQANGNLSSVAYEGVLDPSVNTVGTLEGVRNSQPQLQQQQQQEQVSWLNNQYSQSAVVQQPKQQQHQFFQKQPAIGYASSVQITNAELKSPGIGNGLSLSNVVGGAGTGVQAGSVEPTGIADLKPSIAGAVQGGAATVSAATASRANQIVSDGMNKSDGDNSSLSPAPYSFDGALRGRRSGGSMEKVIERRQRRMIKNRESAARSRARKQAYTMELEAEVAKLKEENMNLKKKQDEIMEMQKAQALERLNQQPAPKKRCLRRTLSGPW